MLRLTGRSMKLRSRLAVTILVLAWLGAAFAARAQDNYEIQVYGSETLEKGHTMVELHSNFTERGNATSTDGTIPTNHQLQHFTGVCILASTVFRGYLDI
jgi:hypothetical protein